ncbi:MFS transporter [Roseomonas sp. OT10]|uniref:MFS transporter n=1 Tax=Roseomonas cutis TaxID=2897332 RepID=UPI001E48486F|nr:MFS transporter [Roseomonas sp. OT10]UFN49711.1 MFS transporter [Roseomonas sp. OT10]
MTPAADGLPVPRRHWATLAAALAICMAVIDGSIANVALPTLAQELQVSPASSIWVVNAYQLIITVLLLPMASLGDIYGYRRVYMVGLAVFVLASLACALSGSLPMLVAARVVQGVGAAALMSTNAALVRFTYPRDQLGRGIGMIALVVATSSALGPTVASGILAVASWPWLFAVNIPLGLAAMVVGWRSLPESPRSGQRFDLASAVLSALAIGLLVGTLDGVAHGASAPVVALQLLVSLLAGVLLVRRQRQERAPLLPLDLLRIPIFALSMGTSVCSFLAQMLAYAALPFHLQTGLGLSAVETGLMMTPWPVATALTAPLAGRLADRYHAGMLGGLGLAIFSLGLASLALLPDQPGAFDIGWRMALAGMGFGLFQSPNNRTIVSSAPRERSGAAGGMLSTARLLGQTTGAALVALVLARSGANGPLIALGLGAVAAAVAAGVSSLRLLTSRPTPGR